MFRLVSKWNLIVKISFNTHCIHSYICILPQKVASHTKIVFFGSQLKIWNTSTCTVPSCVGLHTCTCTSFSWDDFFVCEWPFNSISQYITTCLILCTACSDVRPNETYFVKISLGKKAPNSDRYPVSDRPTSTQRYIFRVEHHHKTTLHMGHTLWIAMCM